MNDSPLTRDFFTDNRWRLSKQLPEAAVAIIPAHSRSQRSGDVAYRFRQNSNFYYLTGIEIADCLLVLAPKHSRREYREILVIPDSNPERALWDGTEPAKQVSDRSGVVNVMERRQLERVFNTIIKQASSIYIPRPNGEPYHGVAKNAAVGKTEAWVRKKVGRKKTRDIKPALSGMRMVKQPVEIECIKRAIDITRSGIASARKLLSEGRYEYELAALIQSEFLKAHSQEAFSSIVASGKNGCTIHYQGDLGRVQKGELVLIDVGAEYGLYAADISRTLPASGRFSRRQGAVFRAVAKVKHRAESLLKPGVTIPDYEKDVRDFMKQQLISLGLLKEGATAKSVAKYFPHATSHFLGLDVHDVGDYNRPLEPGMVLTVEPGIYIPQEGIAVRIEDDILITEKGSQNLSSSIPL